MEAMDFDRELAATAPHRLAERIAHLAAEHATDAVHTARRLKPIRPAAEIQQNLFPPRLARVDAAEIAGGVLPGYDTGGATSSTTRATRRACGWRSVMRRARATAQRRCRLWPSAPFGSRGAATLNEATRLIDETLLDVASELNLTAVLALWDPWAQRLSWLNCGHPSPLLLRADGRLDELDAEHTYPLGLEWDSRAFPMLEVQFGPADLLLIYSDGISERKTATGERIGEDGLKALFGTMGPRSAAQVVRDLENAVVEASPEALADDATLLVVAPGPDGRRSMS